MTAVKKPAKTAAKKSSVKKIVKKASKLEPVDFHKYLTEKTTPQKYNDHEALIIDGGTWSKNYIVVSKNGHVFAHECDYSSDTPRVAYTELFRKLKSAPSPSAIIAKYPTRGANAKCGKLLVVNGDVGFDSQPLGSLVDETSEYEFPTTSFSCLARFYKNPKEMLSRLGSGQLKIVDYTASETIPLTKKEKEARKKNKTLVPPQNGYSIVAGEWHRSGTVLFQDRAKKMCILTGQDEKTYFGVELSKMAETIADAYSSLIPEEVSEYPSYVRQGEWFMVPANEKNVPELKDCAAYSDDYVVLPIDTADSNYHCVHSNDIRVGKDGLIYALDASLEHDQHSSIDGKGWQTFYKNTAKQAFSEEGVD